MALTATQDLVTMRETVFFDGPERGRRLSRFWLLLILASIIAAAGVVADSTATVIGAMIVAPLMTPILGTMLASVIGDRDNLGRCLALVVGGASAAIGVGYVLGLLSLNDVTAATNAQVASRVSPRLIDLVAALATGVVGSISLVRRDIADTLPGVAIAISLVPPLTVVGLTLESGEPHQAMGALLLFATNVTAILATGAIVMRIYGVHRMAAAEPAGPDTHKLNQRHAMGLIALMIIVVGIPLTAGSVSIVSATKEQFNVRAAGNTWASSVGWELVDVGSQEGKQVARFEGPTPLPTTDELVIALRQHGVDPGHVRVELVPRETIDLPG